MPLPQKDYEKHKLT